MDRVCRVCLSQDNLTSIFHEEQELSISYKIMSIASVSISEDDELPHFICVSCIERLHQGYTFKLDCERSDVELRSKIRINNPGKQCTEIIVDLIYEREFQNYTVKNNEIIHANRRKNHDLRHNNENSEEQTNNDSNQETVLSEENSETKKIENETKSPINNYIQELNLVDSNDDFITENKKQSKSPCYICGKVFSSRFRLKTHMRIHAGEKPFTCSYCKKTFTLSHSLKVHERIHTGEKPFTCDICNKKFAQSAGFIVHKRLHTGEKPFPCKFCNAKFRTKSHLDYHIRKHTGEKKFECELCNKAFIASSGLKQHLQTHSGDRQFICCICGLSLTRATHLTRHMKTHNKSTQNSKKQEIDAETTTY